MSPVDRPMSTFDRSMPADVRLLVTTRAELRSWLVAVGVAADDRDAIVLACSEALANAIEHAYRGDPAGVVRIRGRLRGETLEISVSDHGVWVPPQARRGRDHHSDHGHDHGHDYDHDHDRDTVVPFGEVRGRGLRMIEQLMDGTDVSTDDGTTVSMHRRVRIARG